MSIEREGVSDVFIQKLTSQSPLVEMPVKPNYGPEHFRIGIGCARADRRTAAHPHGGFGRPAYNWGLLKLKSDGKKAHQLEVQVTAPIDVYQVRESGRQIRVRQADHDKPAAGGEVGRRPSTGPA